jgi:hypothetical protein
VQVTAERTTLLACLQLLHERLETRHKAGCIAGAKAAKAAAAAAAEAAAPNMMEGIMACAKKQAEVNKCERRESEATQARRAAEAELENLQEQLGVSKKQKERAAVQLPRVGASAASAVGASAASAVGASAVSEIQCIAARCVLQCMSRILGLGS